MALFQENYGPVGDRPEIITFQYTAYYEQEMGPSLKKAYYYFTNFIQPADLPDIKLLTNSIEEKLSTGGRRSVNIDPGYIEVPKLILATTKNFSHRVYIGKGIYGDVQLIWQRGAFQPNPWTYPDYKEEKIRRYFAQIRNNYFKRIKEPTSEYKL